VFLRSIVFFRRVLRYPAAVTRHTAFFALFVVLVVACTGEDPDPVPSGSVGSSGAVGNGSSSSSDASTSGSGEAGTADSGSSSADASDGGGSGNRSINCNATSVCTGADKCCAVGIEWTAASACKADCGGAYELTCDDASDCGNGMTCCYKTDGGARAVASFCALTCRPEQNELQLCASIDECSGGKSCTPLTQFSPSGLKSCN
jgi:hypothetical protein